MTELRIFRKDILKQIEKDLDFILDEKERDKELKLIDKNYKMNKTYLTINESDGIVVNNLITLLFDDCNNYDLYIEKLKDKYLKDNTEKNTEKDLDAIIRDIMFLRKCNHIINKENRLHVFNNSNNSDDYKNDKIIINLYINLKKYMFKNDMKKLKELSVANNEVFDIFIKLINDNN